MSRGRNPVMSERKARNVRVYDNWISPPFAGRPGIENVTIAPPSPATGTLTQVMADTACVGAKYIIGGLHVARMDHSRYRDLGAADRRTGSGPKWCTERCAEWCAKRRAQRVRSLQFPTSSSPAWIWANPVLQPVLAKHRDPGQDNSLELPALPASPAVTATLE